jgi:hypothetical protein
MSGFDDALRKAEEAMKARRAPVSQKRNTHSPTRTTMPTSVPVTPDASLRQPARDDSAGLQMIERQDHGNVVNINGVKLPSIEWVREHARTVNDTLRDDLNAILEEFERDMQNASTSQRTVVVQVNDTQLGKLDDELLHHSFEKLVKAASVRDRWGNRKNILKKGPMGGGKSTAGKQLAKLLGLDFYYLGQTIMPHDVMGYVNQVSGEYQWTPFTRVFVNGGVLYLEEMDGWSPNATLVANAPLANGYVMLPNGEMHERHPDCVIVACTNTWGTGPTAEYVGRNKLDEAFLDRFGIKIDWEYDTELERRAAANDDVVSFVQTARYNAQRYGIKVVISPRSSLDIADMVRAGFSIKEAAEMNFLAGVDSAQRKMLLEDCFI